MKATIFGVVLPPRTSRGSADDFLGQSTEFCVPRLYLPSNGFREHNRGMKPRQANNIQMLKHPCPLALACEGWHAIELTTSPPPVGRPPIWFPIIRLSPRQVIRLVEDPDLPCGQYVVLRDVPDLVEQPDDCPRRTPSRGGCGAPSSMSASRSIARRGTTTT